jgi:integrase
MRGSIRERSPGHWAIILDIVKDGARKRKWHSFKGTKREAQVECARLINELKTGRYIEPSKETLATFLERWLVDIKTRVSPRTYDRYAEIARKNIGPALGAMPLKNLRAQHISAAYANALESGRRKDGSGLSTRTVLHIHRILKQALAEAVQWEMIARNPAANVKPPKAVAKPMQTYDLAQTAELIEAMRGTRLFVPVLLAVLCGLRRGEIAALRWKNVDLAAGQIAVIQSASQTGTVVPIKNRSRAAHAPWHCRLRS